MGVAVKEFSQVKAFNITILS